MVEGTCVFPFVFTAIVKGGEYCLTAANYRGFSSRRQHQMVPLSAFVAGGMQADEPRETDAHSSPFFFSECPSLCDTRPSDSSGQILQHNKLGVKEMRAQH